MPRKTADVSPLTDLRPGDRVRCYDSWSGTVIRVAGAAWPEPYAVVDYDRDQGSTVVTAEYVRPL